MSAAGSRRLPAWRTGATRQAVLDFIDAAAALPVADRVAVFDNDGTLWCEKPSYIQFDFMLAELARAVHDDASVGDRPEFRALLDRTDARQRHRCRDQTGVRHRAHPDAVLGVGRAQQGVLPPRVADRAHRKNWLTAKHNTVATVLFILLGAKVLGDGISIAS